MIDISKGRYWDKPWTLVSGCTPCSSGCDHCWAATMEHRFGSWKNGWNPDRLTDIDGKFRGEIITHPEHLDTPRKRRKPTVYAIWNDWAHEDIPFYFRIKMIDAAKDCPQHTILAFTKRPAGVLDFVHYMTTMANADRFCFPDNWWTGITVCNQQEAEEKIPILLQMPGKKILNIEPMLGPIDLKHIPFWGFDWRLCKACGWSGLPNETILESRRRYRDIADTEYTSFTIQRCPKCRKETSFDWGKSDTGTIDAVILGGETLGNRPSRIMEIGWAENIANQCESVGVPLFVKQLHIGGKVSKDITEWPMKLQKRELPWLKKDR